VAKITAPVMTIIAMVDMFRRSAILSHEEILFQPVNQRCAYYRRVAPTIGHHCCVGISALWRFVSRLLL
jgi:hypothetical protein